MANATIQFWLINATDSWTNPVSKDGGGGFYFQINASAHWSYGTVYANYGSAGSYFDRNGTIAADTWYMYTMVFNDDDSDGNGTVSIYRDGGALAMYGSGAANKAAPTGMNDNLFIGQYSTDNSGAPHGGNYYTDGYLDDVRIYNRALSANEVAAIYNETKDGGYGDLAAPTIRRFHYIPFIAAVTPSSEPVKEQVVEIDLTTDPAGEADVLHEMIPANLRGGLNRMTVSSGGINFTSTGTRAEGLDSHQFAVKKFTDKFVRGANQGDKVEIK
jgi:hypothetical protein